MHDRLALLTGVACLKNGYCGEKHRKMINRVEELVKDLQPGQSLKTEDYCIYYVGVSEICGIMIYLSTRVDGKLKEVYMADEICKLLKIDQ